jgi:hypothetical protein
MTKNIKSYNFYPNPEGKMNKAAAIMFLTISALFIAGSALAVTMGEEISVVPFFEQATMILFGSCLIGLAALRRKFQKK